jgi:diguanylate cyclase (GGDEF)-like protein
MPWWAVSRDTRDFGGDPGFVIICEPLVLATQSREDPKPRVLCVDDEAMNLELLERSLRRRYEVLSAPSPERALEMLRDEREIAVIVSDYRMPGMNGAELLAEAMRVHPEARRVIITGYADSDNLIAAVNSGHIHYLIKKPWRHQDLHQILEQLVETFQLERENKLLLAELRTANAELGAKDRVQSRVIDERGRDLLAATSELERINHELELLAYKDPLTGLYNHRAFHERLREELSRARRYNQPLAVLYADIDSFAALNDELGFEVGDEVLRRIARILANDEETRVRDSDVVARFSGEEFVAVLPETNKAGAIIKANRLREAVARGEYPSGRAVTLSVGVACFPDDAQGPDELVRSAESAVRGAKRGGKNRVHFFTPQGDAGASGGAAAEPGHATTLAVAPAVADADRFRTYHERLGEVVALLQRDRAVGCLFVDLSRLRRIELDLGVAQHADLYDRAGLALDRMRGEQLQTHDIVCRTNDDNAYLVILSPAAGEEHAALALERVAGRVEAALNLALAPEVRDLIRDQPRIVVGHARVLNNSMLRPERLVARLVSEATESARLYRERAAQRDKALLQDIILGDGLSPVYQPIVHIKTGEIFGYEALTRGPRQTPMESPATLFAIADEVDLTFELDRACFRGALRGAVGLEPVHRLFVNLLPMSFYDSAFIEIEASRLLEAAALTPANIVFEITERLAIENFTSFRRTLATYTAMGFGVAIDDVGTRHSNLETVMALRPHFIKISDVLTRGVARSTVKREMLRSLGHIAEAIDAVIVAEGIEGADDLLVLHDLGIGYGQGYYLARPGPPFPRLRASVRRAIRSLAESSRAPTAVPPDYDDDGEESDKDVPGMADRRALFTEMAQGSGEFALGQRPGTEEDTNPELLARLRRAQPAFHPLIPQSDSEGFDDEAFAEAEERTRPHAQPRLSASAPIDDTGWEPVRLQDLGGRESEGAPLLESLRRAGTSSTAGATATATATATAAAGTSDDEPPASNENGPN